MYNDNQSVMILIQVSQTLHAKLASFQDGQIKLICNSVS